MKFLASICAVILLCSACDSEVLPPTTPDRPEQLTHGWVRAEGSIVVREEAFSGEFALVCPSGVTTRTTTDGRYDILLRLERVDTTSSMETCRIDVGTPLIFSRNVELPVAKRADLVESVKFDAILYPDPPAVARIEGPVSAVAAAGAHSCTLNGAGLVYCWGLNKSGELGVGTHMPAQQSTRVLTNERFSTIATSGYIRTWDGGVYVEVSGTCGLRPDGAVFCWGDPMRAAMADSINAKEALVPRRIIGLPTAQKIVGGGVRMCAVTTSRELYCWGGYYNHDAATTRINLSNVIDADISESHLCALTSDGVWHCSGYNFWGEHGDTAAPQRFRQITAGYSFTCGLDQDDVAWCWGRNNVGQLGRGHYTQECPTASGWMVMCPGTDITPQRVATQLRFKRIEAGRYHACGITDFGALHCWGDDARGQLGSELTFSTPVPRVVGTTGARFSSFSVGDMHTCAVATNGKVQCWGEGTYGQLGGGDTGDRTLPADVVPQ